MSQKLIMTDIVYNFLGAAIFSTTNFILRLIFIRTLSVQDYVVYGNIYNIFTTLISFLIIYPFNLFIIQNHQVALQQNRLKNFNSFCFLFCIATLVCLFCAFCIFSKSISLYVFHTKQFYIPILCGSSLLLTGLIEMIATMYIASMKFKLFAIFRCSFLFQILLAFNVKTINDAFFTFTITYVSCLVFLVYKYKGYINRIQIKFSEVIEWLKKFFRTSVYFYMGTVFDLTIWSLIPLILVRHGSTNLSGQILSLTTFQQLLVFFVGFISNYFYAQIAKSIVQKQIKSVYYWVKTSILYFVTINIILGISFILLKKYLIPLMLGAQYDTVNMHCFFTTFIVIVALDNTCNIIIGVLRIFKDVLKYIWIRTLISYSCFLSCYFLFFVRNQNGGTILITVLTSNFLGIFASIFCIKRKISYHQIFYNT